MPHERLYRTEAVVLRRSDFGEADRFLTLYTPLLGKVRVLAKGVRKIASRKAGHLELFMRSQLLLARGRDLDIITQAEAIDTYRPLREDLIRATYASYTVELLDRFVEEENENRPLYDLFIATLARLAQAKDLALVVRYYELHLLSLVGYQPQLFRCAECGSALEAEDQFFSAALGGVLCPTCGPNHRAESVASTPLTLAALKVLRFAQTHPFGEVANLQLRPALHAELERTMQQYITYLLERNLKSVEFLRLLRREAAQRTSAITEAEAG
jgi:DNA repair protein RecO (recombination protein O)